MGCSNGFDRWLGSIAARRRQTILRLLPIFLLAACGQQAAYGPGGGRIEIGADGWRRPTHYYPPPGPQEDPWGPYIREAAARYRVPERWVRAVMQQESGGEQQATSPVGAMGLMQVMPATYEELRVRHQLGDDPYDPHNSILAGTAYIREMYDRFGAPGFLAAYNAGPDRVDSYLAGRAVLPDETVNYLAAITPNLGAGVPRSGPFVVASARSGRASRYGPTVASLAAGCDLNAAYNPSHPCSTLLQAAAQPVNTQPAYTQPAYTQPAYTQQAYAPEAAVRQVGAGGCDLDAAYDPAHPCTSSAQSAAEPSVASVQRAPTTGLQLASAANCDPNAAFNPARPCRAATVASAVVLPPHTRPVSAASHQPIAPSARVLPGRSAEPAGGWAIQVGAFASPSLARTVAEGARAQAPDQLRSAALALQPTAPFGSKVLYRARLAHLSASAASNACARLNHRQLPCVVVPPNRS
jgi:D-alanyl-D-alanine carboxypeptidase